LNAKIHSLTHNLKKIQIHKSGLEVLTLTELNKKGVPFQSWKIPMDPGPWYISKGYIFKDLDIEGLQLQIPTKGAWSIAQPSKDRVKLQEIDAVKGLGCVPEELCLTTPDNKRFFRLPPVCGKEPISDSH
jgi:hypothetical protein